MLRPRLTCYINLGTKGANFRFCNRIIAAHSVLLFMCQFNFSEQICVLQFHCILSHCMINCKCRRNMKVDVHTIAEQTCVLFACFTLISTHSPSFARRGFRYVYRHWDPYVFSTYLTSAESIHFYTVYASKLDVHEVFAQYQVHHPVCRNQFWVGWNRHQTKRQLVLGPMYRIPFLWQTVSPPWHDNGFLFLALAKDTDTPVEVRLFCCFGSTICWRRRHDLERFGHR